MRNPPKSLQVGAVAVVVAEIGVVAVVKYSLCKCEGTDIVRVTQVL